MGSIPIVSTNAERNGGRLEIERVAGGMRARGWVLLSNEEPPSIHLTVDPMTDEAIRVFLTDLIEVVGLISAGGPSNEEASTMAWRLVGRLLDGSTTQRDSSSGA